MINERCKLTFKTLIIMCEVNSGVLISLGVNQTDGAAIVGKKRRKAIHTSIKYRNSVLLSSLDIVRNLWGSSTYTSSIHRLHHSTHRTFEF